MKHIKLAEKGSNIYIYEITDCYGKQMEMIDIVLGEDILKSNDKYVDYNGVLVIPEKEVEDAVHEYMSYNYPEIHDYMFEIDDRDKRITK
jgi:hypothetical protein